MKAYVPAIDGLRALAVGLVILYHSYLTPLLGGFVGVDVFFVLSGFLITSILVREHAGSRGISLKRFYVRRLFRLQPALWTMLLVYTIYNLLIENPEPYIRGTILSFFNVSNLAAAFFSAPMFGLGHTWSLAIEEQFYLIWPFVLSVLLRVTGVSQVAIVAFVVAIMSWILRWTLSSNGVPVARIYNGLDTRIDGLMIGCAFALLLASPWMTAEREHSLRRIVLGLTIPALVTLFGMLVFARKEDEFNPLFAVAVCATCTVLVLHAVCIKESIFIRVLSTPWVVWLGTVSYSLYLWHFPIFHALIETGMRRTFWLPLGIAISIATAAASFYFIERPIRNSRARRATIAALPGQA